MQEKWALLGIHDEGVQSSIERYLEYKEYEYHSVNSVDDLIIHARDETYSVVIMDANFKNPGSTDLSPVRSVYAILKQRISEGTVRLAAFTARKDAVELGKKEGLPVVDKLRFNLVDYIK